MLKSITKPCHENIRMLTFNGRMLFKLTLVVSIFFQITAKIKQGHSAVFELWLIWAVDFFHLYWSIKNIGWMY